VVAEDHVPLGFRDGLKEFRGCGDDPRLNLEAIPGELTNELI